ncbi:hypothetical protein [Fusibacter sp. 3D3]|uniref:hypothetical protein n=1 Tax=Fusibacter sp. 3D3 TaxID=1048380 RepID=UPI001586CD01|nr:hypothetical protein [Fusibacter sp. 3D3]
MFTGLRQSEILALTHADIENDLIKVNKTLNRVKKDGRNQVIITAPKTPSSQSSLHCK